MNVELPEGPEAVPNKTQRPGTATAPLSERLDKCLRFVDLRTRRTAGGWLDRRLHIRRHTYAAVLLPATLCAFLVLASPTWQRWVFAVVVGIVVGQLVICQLRWTTKNGTSIVWDFIAQVVICTMIGGMIWIIGPDEYREDWPYRHMLIPLAAAVTVALLAGVGLLHLLFGWLEAHSKYRDYLRRTELFASRGMKMPSSKMEAIISAAALAARAPLALLTLPALATLVVPSIWVHPVLIASIVVSIAILLLAGASDRFGDMWLLLQEDLFKGGALLTSLVAIALAAARIAGITYVTTLFDSAAWWAISVGFASAYVLSWWFDYWFHRMLTDAVMRLVAPNSKGVAEIPYPIDHDAVRTSVPAKGRRLQIHGSSRFLVINNHGPSAPYFQALRPMQLLSLLANSGAPGGKADPTPNQVASRMANYQALTGVVFAALVGAFFLITHDGVQMPEATAQSHITGASLKKLIEQRSAEAGDEPLFIVAASGGGTRAAVYTAAILEAIAFKGNAKNIVLGSGVSGGGAALAYFAGHRKELVEGKREDWDRYFEVMTKPFIQDVLQQSTEWYMAKEGRLGMLLEKSFQAHWNMPSDRRTLADVHDVGLILNTSLAGHFDRPSQADCDDKLRTRRDPDCDKLLYVVEQKRRAESKSTLAGGRLLLTNLDDIGSLTSKAIEPDAKLHPLPIIVGGEKTTLTQAAALNANFPPVFSNAAIDVDNTSRYWVTDGGAVDNRGIEMMLFTIRHLIENLTDDQLPKLHVIVADASALSEGFDQDRGISTTTGAGSHFASHLDAELVAAIDKKYEHRAGRFKFSYVMMPDILRTSGSFGTHWMLQPTIKVEQLLPPGASTDHPPKLESVTLSGIEMVNLLRAMHAGSNRPLSADACKVMSWISLDQANERDWSAVLTAIHAQPSPKHC